ncbi:MAG: sigma-70 family RNA polymerase sigma factor [Planctomycetes bacterium]|nr:sigma-70 family RNA polymerase sigma factor [Planctomycetota bacterium]
MVATTTVNPPDMRFEPETTKRHDLLLERVLRQDADALDGFCRQEHPRIWRVAFGLLGDASQADDLAQEALIRLLDRLPGRDPQRSFASWRDTLVINLCRDHLRSTTNRRRFEGQAPALPARLPAPDAALRQDELRGLLSEALKLLPPREREVFVLRDLEGCSNAQVAESLGIQESSVRSLLSLSRGRLKSALAHRLGGV